MRFPSSRARPRDRTRLRVHPQNSDATKKAPIVFAFLTHMSACAPQPARDPSASVGMTGKPQGYRARVEQAIVFTVSAWDSNCPQHIPQRLEAAEVKALLAERQKRIEELTAELDRLRKLQTISPRHR
jgi:hypothetical protein